MNHMESDWMPMTDAQAKRAEITARLDELARLKDSATDQNTLNLIREREKVLRTALDKLLST